MINPQNPENKPNQPENTTPTNAEAPLLPTPETPPAEAKEADSLEKLTGAQVEEVTTDTEGLPPFLIDTEEEPNTPPAQEQPPASVPSQHEGGTKKTKFKLPFKFSEKTILLIIGGIIFFLLFILLLLLALQKKKTTPVTTTPQKVTITMWGLWYPSKVMQPLIEEYQKQNPSVEINYIQQDYQHTDPTTAYSGAYFNKALERIALAGGVDIIEVHHSWLPLIIGKLTYAPNDTLSVQTIQQQFYPNIAAIITNNGQGVIGLPLFADTMVMFYNKDIIDDNLAQSLQTWDDVIQLLHNNPNLKGKVALGTFSNVFHAPEMFLLFMEQGGVSYMNHPLFNLSTADAASALSFYLRFFTDYSAYTPQMPSDLKAFAQCQLALIFAPSYRYINFINSNKDLHIGVAPIPKLGGAPQTRPRTIGSFYLFVVPQNSPNAKEAWKFLVWLNKPENLQKIYNAQKQLMLEGQAFARQDLATTQNSQFLQTVHASLKESTFPLIYSYGIWEQQVRTNLIPLEKTPNNVDSALTQLQENLNQQINQLLQQLQ